LVIDLTVNSVIRYSTDLLSFTYLSLLFLSIVSDFSAEFLSVNNGWLFAAKQLTFQRENTRPMS